MKEALFYEKLDGAVQCKLCPHFCTISEGERGKCRVRKVEDGKLFSLVYGKPCSLSVDPIEKKPLHHFLPGSRIFSLATPGCNLSCQHCQNWEISQARPETFPSREVSPEEVVERAEKSGCESIAYTYTEPTIFIEYAMAIAELARKRGLKNVTVTNGFVNPEPAEELYSLVDATNIDLKGMSEKFYEEVCGARLGPVLEAIKLIHGLGVWVELTNLVIPTKNDSPEMIKDLCEWVADEVSVDVPLHFSSFRPAYKMSDLPPTPEETLREAKKIAEEVGLNYVYLGNVNSPANTHCPECGELLVERRIYATEVRELEDGKCKNCGEKIPGVWH